MSSERWQQVWEVFEKVIELPPEAWPAALDEACGQDEKLRRGVEEMLDADRQADSFLDRPFGQQPGTGETDPAAADDAPQRPIGSRIGPYRILERLGEGGMGVVYRGERAEPVRREVAIKVVRAGLRSVEARARFDAERQALALMDHPNVARILDGGTTTEGVPYFAMELVRGEAITDFCDTHGLDLDTRI